MKRNFKEKVVVITGGAGGLGKALCQEFAQQGAYVVALDILETALEELENCTYYQCDISDEKQCTESINKVIAKHGKIDVLINNAGITHFSNFLETDIATIVKVMAVNFFGAVYCTKAALPGIIANKGMIITISSVAGFSPLIARSGYSSSKYALHGFFETLRTELQQTGVNVLLVCPAFINTGIRKSAMNGDGNAQIRKPGDKQKMVGKIHTPEAIAKQIFLGACANKRLLKLGNVAKMGYWLYRLFPRVYEYFMIKKVKKQ